jgi:sugar phosphate permease
VVKFSLLEDETLVGMSPGALNVVETAFLLLYAVGQFAIGPLGDRFGAKPLLIIAFVGAAGLMAACGSAKSASVLATVWGLNGLVQGGVFPLNMKALAPWLGKASRGAVLGLWTTCQQVGGVASTALTGYLASTFGWRSTFLYLAPVVGTAGLALTLLPTKQETADPKTDDKLPSGGPRPSFSQVLFIPNLLRLGGAYFCVKLVRYIMMFWLPFYLQSSWGFDAATAAYTSLVFDLGGALGNVACGLLSDSLFGTCLFRWGFSFRTCLQQLRADRWPADCGNGGHVCQLCTLLVPVLSPGSGWIDSHQCDDVHCWYDDRWARFRTGWRRVHRCV